MLRSVFSKILVSFVLVSFLTTSVVLPSHVSAQMVMDQLPQPGSMVNLSSAYEPLMIKGLKINPDNPMQFDFLVSKGDTGFDVRAEHAQPLHDESQKLIKYFLACLTIPEDDLWVNLSPYEKDRMIPDALGQTELGRDLLAQDYILKQLTASMIYPEKSLGKEFWDRVYTKARQLYGTSEIPVNTFNKVWILADTAKVFERNNTAFVVSAHLKVMLDEDYVANEKHSFVGAEHARPLHGKDSNQLGSEIIRQIILPEIEKEINSGKNFATIRQIFHAFILASWYKKNLKSSLLNQVYSNKEKVNGINLDDPKVKEEIYQRYLQAYKKGVFNYIKEDIDAESHQPTPRKYFSGGTVFHASNFSQISNSTQLTSAEGSQLKDVDFAVTADIKNAAMRSTSKESSIGTFNFKEFAEKGYITYDIGERKFLFYWQEGFDQLGKRSVWINVIDLMSNKKNSIGTFRLFFKQKDLDEREGLNAYASNSGYPKELIRAALAVGKKIQQEFGLSKDQLLPRLEEQGLFIEEKYRNDDKLGISNLGRILTICALGLARQMGANNLYIEARGATLNGNYYEKFGAESVVDRFMVFNKRIPLRHFGSVQKTEIRTGDRGEMLDFFIEDNAAMTIAAEVDDIVYQKGEGPPAADGGIAIKDLFDSQLRWATSLKINKSVQLPAMGKGLHIVLLGPGKDAGELQAVLDHFSLAKQIDVVDKLDLSKDVERIKLENKDKADRITFIQQDISVLRNRIKQADLVIALRVMDVNFISQQGLKNANDNIYNMLKPGGMLISGELAENQESYRTDWVNAEQFDVFKPDSLGYSFIIKRSDSAMTVKKTPPATGWGIGVDEAAAKLTRIERKNALEGVISREEDRLRKMSMGGRPPNRRDHDLAKDTIEEAGRRIKEEDSAMIINKNIKGGIDLKTSDLKMNIEKQGKGIQMNLDPALLKQFQSANFTGVVPVIIKITPIIGAMSLLGIDPVQKLL